MADDVDTSQATPDGPCPNDPLDIVWVAMNFAPRFATAAVVGAAVLTFAGCGDADSGFGTATSAEVLTSTPERADLAGVRVEVRRDPG